MSPYYTFAIENLIDTMHKLGLIDDNWIRHANISTISYALKWNKQWNKQ